MKSKKKALGLIGPSHLRRVVRVASS